MAEQEAGRGEGLRIVFDGPPSHEAGRFVEVEDATGRSVNAGTWHERDDGLWELRLRESDPGEQINLPPDSITRYVVEPCVPDHDCEWVAWEYGNPQNGATGDTPTGAIRALTATPTDEASEATVYATISCENPECESRGQEPHKMHDGDPMDYCQVCCEETLTLRLHTPPPVEEGDEKPWESMPWWIEDAPDHELKGAIETALGELWRRHILDKKGRE